MMVPGLTLIWARPSRQVWTHYNYLRYYIITHQPAELSQRFCNLGNVPQLHQVLRLEHLRHSVTSHLKDDGVDPVQDGVAAPVSVDLLPRHRVEADGDHEPRQDGS